MLVGLGISEMVPVTLQHRLRHSHLPLWTLPQTASSSPPVLSFRCTRLRLGKNKVIYNGR